MRIAGARRALGALTTRGRSFVAAGLVVIGSGFVLGERDLLRVGVLVLVLPALSALAVRRTGYRLSCERRIDPVRTERGRAARVGVRLQNVSRLPTGLLLLEDHVPYALGGRPRFVLERVEPYGVREISYRVRSDLRGRFQVGPLTVRVTDPFALVELDRSFTATDQLIVTPTIVELPALRLPGARRSGGDGDATASAGSAGEDDVVPRPYRHGDDLRRVHWRSTARHGELMVRREERPRRARATILLDTRRIAHRGSGPGSSFEAAVSAAASIALRLNRDGTGIRVATEEGEISADGGDSAYRDLLLDALAVARTSRQRSLSAGVAALRRIGEGGLTVAVLGRLSDADHVLLEHLRRPGGTAVAVLLDVAAFAVPGGTPGAESGPGSADASADRLRRAGWHVLPVSPTTPLTVSWQGLGPAPADPVARVIPSRERDPGPATAGPAGGGEGR